jgi:hypothetical protein
MPKQLKPEFDLGSTGFIKDFFFKEVGGKLATNL